MPHALFIADTLRLLSWNYIQYKTGLISSLKCIKNIVSSLSRSNIIYLKIIQSLATNGALFDIEQRQYLEQYTDNVPYNNSDIDTTFITTLKTISNKNNKSFNIVEPIKPFRSGLIALVYKATLNGKPIVIKVMRKNIRDKIIKALNEFESLLHFLSWIPQIKAMNIIAIMRENRVAMIDQTNFSKELQNMQEMQKLCDFTDYVKIPDVYSEYTNANNNIIVMEFLDGKKINDVTSEEAIVYSKLLAQFEVKTTLFNNLYHADLHSGNILFMKNDKNNEIIGIFDFGIVGRSSKEQQEAFYNIFRTADAENNNGYDTTIALLDGIAEPKDILHKLTPKQRETIVNTVKPCVVSMLHSSEGITPNHLYLINKQLLKYNMYLANEFCKMHMAMLAIDSVSHKLNGRVSHLNNIRSAVKDMFSDIENIISL